MFVLITCQNNPVTLDYPLDNRHENLRVALHEISYKVKWFNISKAKGNNLIRRVDRRGNTTKNLAIPDGYYGFCTLQELLSGFGISLKLNDANLKSTLTFNVDQNQVLIFYFSIALAKMLGFDTVAGHLTHGFRVSADNNTFEGENPIDLAINPLLYVHLDEVNTNENLYNGRPSALLRVIPAGSAAYSDLKIATFPNLQFKTLARRHIEKLNLRITDQKGKDVCCDDLHAVLEIK